MSNFDFEKIGYAYTSKIKVLPKLRRVINGIIKKTYKENEKIKDIEVSGGIFIYPLTEISEFYRCDHRTIKNCFGASSIKTIRENMIEQSEFREHARGIFITTEQLTTIEAMQSIRDSWDATQLPGRQKENTYRLIRTIFS